MSTFRKMTAVVLSVVMLVCMFTVTAGAASIADTAKAISSGESQTIKYSKNETVINDYAVKLSKKGNIVVSLSSNVWNIEIRVYDENGKMYQPDSDNIKTGSIYKSFTGYTSCDWNSTVEKFNGTLTYKNMKKGTYYFRFEKQSKWHGGSGSTGKATLKITYPSSESESASKLTSIAIPMKVGDTMLLSTDAGDSGIKWSSSKSSVASVSSDGKVTAKKAGTADITAALGDSKVKIQIKVTK